MSRDKDRGQKLHEKHQLILANMLREEENKYCADCRAKGNDKLFITFTDHHFLFRTQMGLLEHWHIYMYTLCRDTQEFRSPHISCQVCKP